MSLSPNGVLMTHLSTLPDGPELGWKSIIAAELMRGGLRYEELDIILAEKYAEDKVNPAAENIFRAFRECPFDQTVLVICRQDPYPRKEHATGLAFSVPAGCKQPPTLRNILKELQDDIGGETSAATGDLSSWAQQGGLLLNTALTVETGSSNSHKVFWGDFSTQVLLELNRARKTPLAFILWGGHAQQIGHVLEGETPPGAPRLFLFAPHPSPLSSYRGFFGSKPFSKTNRFLTDNGLKPIQWRQPTATWLKSKAERVYHGA